MRKKLKRKIPSKYMVNYIDWFIIDKDNAIEIKSILLLKKQTFKICFSCKINYTEIDRTRIKEFYTLNEKEQIQEMYKYMKDLMDEYNEMEI